MSASAPPAKGLVASLHCMYRGYTMRQELLPLQVVQASCSLHNHRTPVALLTATGAWVGVGYTMIGLIAWVGSYFFRVATKNMTYAVQVLWKLFCSSVPLLNGGPVWCCSCRCCSSCCLVVVVVAIAAGATGPTTCRVSVLVKTYACSLVSGGHGTRPCT